ncbi:alpha,alpha-trehalose-phosphate synthase (UDP-forming) [Roseibium sp.]|uniref:alpha,alpha-trehalose-phosphate synthase (UDP-forming) n=1 Tax=Roseibium sp. TaxID=1936156 RepID=UPI003A96C2DE
MSRLVVISNRMPLGDNPSGGLVVALRDTMEEQGGLWVGIAQGDEADQSGAPQSPVPRLQDHPGLSFDRKCLTVPPELYDDYYLGYSNSVLWPLCHGRTDLIDLQQRYRKAYIEVNRRLAKAVALYLKPDDRIWVHDYHLFPLADALREEGVLNPIGFFLHIPFPSAANVGALTHVGELAKWLAAYDLVGLQTNRDVASCLEVFRTLPGAQMLMDGSIRYRDRMVDLKSFPIGIEAKAFGQMAARTCGQSTLADDDSKLVIGADRLDYSKGLPQRFLAFDHLLETRDEWRGRINYLQIASPTREDVQAYREIREELEQLSGAINGRFSDIGYTPLQYLHRTVDRNRLAGLYRNAKVGLVIPLADGMNLVAKEYVAAQDPADPGVLVLSGFAGAAEQLGEHALIANPYDSHQMAECIHKALSMPLTERQERHAALLENVLSEDVAWWANSFLKALRDKAMDEDFLQLLAQLREGQSPLKPVEAS